MYRNKKRLRVYINKYIYIYVRYIDSVVSNLTFYFQTVHRSEKATVPQYMNLSLYINW